MTPRTIQIRRPYLDLIVAGVKRIEVRVGYPSMRKIQVGDALVFESGDLAYETAVAKVVEYPDFPSMLAAEDHTAIGGESLTGNELLAVCREIYPPEKEAALGVLAIHLAPASGTRHTAARR